MTPSLPGGPAGLLAAPLDQLLEAIAGEHKSPGGGVAAAVTAALAAAVLSMVARVSGEGWSEAGGMLAQAELLRARAGRLGEAEAQVYGDVLRLLEGDPGDSSPSRDAELGQALARSAEVPLRIAETSTDIAALARHAAEAGDESVLGDAVAAAVLAAAAAQAAARLVEVNLGATAADERVSSARALAGAAVLESAAALAART